MSDIIERLSGQTIGVGLNQAAITEIRRLRAEVERLTRVVACGKRREELLHAHVDRYIPCPDHRDKVDARTGGCLVCRAEAAERKLAEEREALDKARDFILWLTPCGQPEAGPPPDYRTIGDEARKVYEATNPSRAALGEGEKCPRCGVLLGGYAVCPEGSAVRYCSEACAALGEGGGA